MKIYQMALGLLIFSAVATLFNEVKLFPVDVLHTGAVVNTSDINNTFEITTTGKTGGSVQTSSSIIDQIVDLGGGLLYFAQLIVKTLGLALGLGGLVQSYFPGDVGVSIGTMITGISYLIYAWGGMQIYRKVSTKGMD